ncbi:DUF3152 domain-containing protein [Kitasatospora purpeofusca]|uniref:DUF3152 domain-containing protein n=1 Tax=Kitasatospora purpeofusca TaxID=67352 RepID=UPI0022563926|nr:DUF3152 domain-containing protein [Kitasatospora purpeofusca]MCX4686873.1 DUF3152 domain-containing protein [Kitasatospora purpeofusca]
MLTALVAAVLILGGTLFVLNRPDALPGADRTAQARVAPPDGTAAAPAAPAAPAPPAPQSGPPAAVAPAPVTPSAPPAPAAPPSPAATPQPGGPETPPAKGAGTFTVAQGSADPVGRGTVRRYRVEVEDGIGIDPTASAAQIQGILADRRGWTNDRRNGFQLVSSGAYDFTVKIASAATVDRICGAAGLDTRGEVNCNVGNQVVVNVKRWTIGSPQFGGPIDEYRALVINHEVGHRIGHGHEGCPGPGKPAPAMMQQIYGLKGCTANAWPYSAEGSYLSGPAVP